MMPLGHMHGTAMARLSTTHRALLPAGSCGTYCNEHTFECFIGEVHEACCDEGGRNCVDSQDVPLTCPVGCALVYPQFIDICAAHVSASGYNLAEFQDFESQCLEQVNVHPTHVMVSREPRAFCLISDKTDR
jgi:hypothetical protein